MTLAQVESGTGYNYSVKGFRFGYTAIDGNQALVVVTYTRLCFNGQHGQQCFAPNKDPKAGLDSGKSFKDLWTAWTTRERQAERPASSGDANGPVRPAYLTGLTALVNINGTW